MREGLIWSRNIYKYGRLDGPMCPTFGPILRTYKSGMVGLQPAKNEEFS
jgi:hypothetical protein